MEKPAAVIRDGGVNHPTIGVEMRFTLLAKPQLGNKNVS
jgi:hypothetical protein